MFRLVLLQACNEAFPRSAVLVPQLLADTMNLINDRVAEVNRWQAVQKRLKGGFRVSEFLWVLGHSFGLVFTEEAEIA